MTTRELIGMLMALDPEGNIPVVVGNHDIYFAQRLPGHYDGARQELLHDNEKRGRAWSVIGAKVTTGGEKISIRPMSIAEVLVDMPDLPIEGADPTDVARWRSEAAQD